MKGRVSKSHKYDSGKGEKGSAIFVKSKRLEGGLTIKKTTNLRPKSQKHSKSDLAKANAHMKKHGG